MDHHSSTFSSSQSVTDSALLGKNLLGQLCPIAQSQSTSSRSPLMWYLFLHPPLGAAVNEGVAHKRLPLNGAVAATATRGGGKWLRWHKNARSQ